MAPPTSWIHGHGGVIRVAERTGGTLGSRLGGVGLATLCGGTAFCWPLSPSLHGRVPGFCAYRTKYNVQQGQAEVREANLSRGDGRPTEQRVGTGKS